ncbi:hypothetical protein COL154_008792 [Colletotrichum chrysophilum]|uniref:uncharacterized protein n=1 Tax=Colletotrichum chrysophilum TaxID=1836956 RepID=UPI0023013BF0|nr:uncharacterized protein COL26b_008975 [Colletotrichum chrysophilum]KAJ0346113.1 hypothetical protein KNSL1_007798 [Colletotrichum chrysophilum]KAJ0358870.1 hypothetical protein COL154_008792 [Colletotrichum chrysophilum]KAJ0372853.1 hypothetical protein COL26b_008975 [Colletotrichum chrysophilum]
MALTPASLDSLPTEILSEVISYIADLRTLYHLITASPSVSRIFDSPTMGPEAFEHVLANSTAPQVFGLVRLVAIVRTATADDPPATSLDAFVKRANHHMQHSGRGQFYSSIPPLTRTYQRQKTGAVRSLLQIARRIAYLTPACLSYYREQWLSATPSHAEGDMRGWVYKTWKNRYAGRPYSPDDIGPPVWIEEHRVTRGFWRLQLLYELQRATSENRLGWKMDETRGPVSAEGLYGALRYEKEEFFTVSDFVNRIQGESSSWSLPCPTTTASVTEWPEPAPPLAVDEPAGHTRGYLMSQNPVGWVYANIRLRHFPPSPIRGVPLQPFRRLGLFIWEYDKLVKMELMSPTGYPFSAKGEPSKMYTWRSLLSQEILAEVEENLDLGSNRRQTTHTDAAFGLPPL